MILQDVAQSGGAYTEISGRGSSCIDQWIIYYHKIDQKLLYYHFYEI